MIWKGEKPRALNALLFCPIPIMESGIFILGAPDGIESRPMEIKIT